MAFDLNIWRAEVRRNVEDFARDPRGALGRAGVDTVYGFLLGSTVLPVIAAYNADPAATIGAMISVLGGLGANLLANLAQRKYDETPIAAAAAEAQSPELAPAYQAITQQTEVLQLAELALQQAGQVEILAQLRDELRRLAPGGPFAGATIVQQQSGGVNFGVGNTIGSVGDMVTGSQTRGAVDNQGHIDGVVVGVNLGTIIYGRTPQEDERRRLVWYLDALANKLYRLLMRGIEQRLEQGDGMALPKVYVMSAIESTIDIRVEASNLHHYFKSEGSLLILKQEFHPDWVLPHLAIRGFASDEVFISYPQALQDNRFVIELAYSMETQTVLTLKRNMLASEATYLYSHLVLLGDSGSGKSTFIYYLAWALAQRGLDQSSAPALFGWPDDASALPLLLPLRTLASAIAKHGAQPRSLAVALSAELVEHYNVREAEVLIEQVLHSRGALLLLDGLDEVPAEAAPGHHADRLTVLRVVREFTQLYPEVRAVLTCRTRTFNEGMHAELGWRVDTLEPFTLGQIREFVPAWYKELVAHGQLDPTQAKVIEEKLISTITDPKRGRLRTMAENPLLLTMMALVLYNQGDFPRDRPQLYERVLNLLLGQWDKVKAHAGESLAEAVGMSGWESRDFLPLLDRLCYEAHRDASSADGRGRIGRGALTLALIDFFKAARASAPGDTALRCLDYLDQRSGLLVVDSPDTYVFAHLILQEHGAGRYLSVQSEDPVGLLLKHRADERWREPIMLGAGLLRPGDLNTLLTDLIDREEANRRKADVRWYRDLFLAVEIGQDRNWDILRTHPAVKVDRLQRDLRAGLAVLLADTAQPLFIAERVRAGFFLGELGDPRYPVTLDDWRRELTRTAGDTNSYFCKFEEGAYIIGSADNDLDAEDNEKPQHRITFDMPFWISRYPITNEQWQLWVSEGGGKVSHYADNTDLNQSNKPVVGVDWFMCNDFCIWLSAQLVGQGPDGYVVRLPTEFEWEAAARGVGTSPYPWGDRWIGDYAAMEEDQEMRDSKYTLPVGCYPASATACGALDMAGNVWEWTASNRASYPAARKLFVDEDMRILRGGSYRSDRRGVRCTTRVGSILDFLDDSFGFRVVVAPRSH